MDREIRIEGVSWFKEELPSEEEYEEGLKNLEKNNYTVDYIVTHTAPADVAAEFGFGAYEESERQAEEFQRYADEVEFKHWFCGHFHIDDDVEDTYHCLIDRVVDLDDFQ